jgi:DnaJ-domain-containing protein 1
VNLLLPLIAALVVGFGTLLLLRVSAARRGALLNNWPAILFTLIGLVALMRGGLWLALAMAAAAGFAWFAAPTRQRVPPPRQPAPQRSSPGDAEARAILGVRLHASEEEIRAAFRAKMAEAHPDRGGSDAAAARLVAARDRLMGRG